MSTKIYDGIKIKSMNMLELNDFIKNLRKEMEPIARKELLKMRVSLFEAAMVYVNTGIQMHCPIKNWKSFEDIDPHNFKKVWSNTEFEVVNIIKKNEKARTLIEYCSDFDFDAKLVILPIERKLLGIKFINNEKLEKALMARPEISDYSYWDNTDRPDSISADSWKRRKENWDKALPGIGIPAENGFEYVILDTMRNAYFWISSWEENIIPYLTPKETLTTNVAKTKLMEIKHDEFKKEDEEKHKENPLRVYFKARDYVNAHPEEVEALMKTIDIDIEAIIKTQIKN